jgi:hypothetical protein
VLLGRGGDGDLSRIEGARVAGPLSQPWVVGGRGQRGDQDQRRQSGGGPWSDTWWCPRGMTRDRSRITAIRYISHHSVTPTRRNCRTNNTAGHHVVACEQQSNFTVELFK